MPSSKGPTKGKGSSTRTQATLHVPHMACTRRMLGSTRTPGSLHVYHMALYQSDAELGPRAELGHEPSPIIHHQKENFSPLKDPMPSLHGMHSLLS